MSGNLVVLGYVAVITLGLRWKTLPEDIAYLQQVLSVGTTFCFSVVKHLLKKRLSTFTDNSLVYPRPPRNDFATIPALPEAGDSSDEEGEHGSESSDTNGDSNDQNDKKSDDEERDDEDDVDKHGDTEEKEEYENENNEEKEE